MMWTQARNLCGKSVAIDANRNVWLDHGCEDGGPNFARAGTATEAQASDIAAKLAVLPAASPTITSCSGRMDEFAIIGGSSPKTTAACSTSAVYDDVTALPAAFQPAATAFKALE